jgi:type I restriction enzyme R subunit
MISRYAEFTSGYFDVVVVDESHRSIYGAWQTALTHFDALHIGLTATPSAFIERNTFQFYQCRDGQPDFAFPIQESFKENFLVPYKFATGITVILAQGADVDDETYDPAEFERKWTNEDTNKKMMQEFDRLAWDNYKELAPGQKIAPGKTIVFAITKHHAARLAQYLNELHPELKGRYAEVITSDVANADDMIRKFKREEYPQVAVSVGMLDTGFDCREVLHLVMCRRVRSPILYQQMRGRGTRTAPHIQKRKFVIYDFFGNHDYFNDSDTDIFTGTGSGHARAGERKSPRHAGDLIELGLEDEWLHAVAYVEVGPGGERVDKRDYVTNWEVSVQSAAKEDSTIQKIRRGDLLTEDEEKTLAERLNKPEMYFNEENLRRAYRQPGGNLVDFIKAALGSLTIKPREEELTENFQAWLVAKSLTPQQAQYLSLLKNRGIARGRIELGDLFQPPLSILNAAGLGVELFGEKGLKEVIQDMNESVFQKKVA